MERAVALRAEGRVDRTARLLSASAASCPASADRVAPALRDALSALGRTDAAPGPRAERDLRSAEEALERGDAGTAAAAFEAALSQDDRDARALVGAGLAHLALGRTRRARE